MTIHQHLCDKKTDFDGWSHVWVDLKRLIVNARSNGLLCLHQTFARSLISAFAGKFLYQISGSLSFQQMKILNQNSHGINFAWVRIIGRIYQRLGLNSQIIGA